MTKALGFEKMATIETIGSELIRLGVEKQLIVVPELSLRSPADNTIKKVDLAWLRLYQGGCDNRLGSLRHWELVAVFEIEGCDVPLSRIDQHIRQFGAIQNYIDETFSKNVVLYTEAYHRADPSWEKPNPDKLIESRMLRATERVLVRDGRNLDWANEIA